MTYHVLDVGQCDADNYRISEVLSEHFDVEIVRAHNHDQAINFAASGPFDLILINRLYDRDRSEGMNTLKALKSGQATADVPVILVSNFDDAQAEAVAAGAVPGFGKRFLSSPETIRLLAKYLDKTA